MKLVDRLHSRPSEANSCSAMANAMGWLGYRWAPCASCCPAKLVTITGPVLVVDGGATLVGPSRASQ